MPKSSFQYIMEACALNNLLCYYTENDVFTKVGGRRYDYVSFVNPKGRNSRSQVYFKTDAFKNLRNFTGKNLCWGLFLIKLFSCEIRTFLRTPFF